MADTKISAAQEAVELTKQLTSALFRKDSLQRQRINLDQDIALCEQNIVALQNLVTGIELGKKIEVERVTVEKAAAEKALSEKLAGEKFGQQGAAEK